MSYSNRQIETKELDKFSERLMFLLNSGEIDFYMDEKPDVRDNLLRAVREAYIGLKLISLTEDKETDYNSFSVFLNGVSKVRSSIHLCITELLGKDISFDNCCFKSKLENSVLNRSDDDNYFRFVYDCIFNPFSLIHDNLLLKDKNPYPVFSLECIRYPQPDASIILYTDIGCDEIFTDVPIYLDEFIAYVNHIIRLSSKAERRLDYIISHREKIEYELTKEKNQ